MKRALRLLWIIPSLLLCAGLLKASLPQTTIGTWTSAASLSQSRSNASAVMLSDSRILIIGGDGASGPLQSAEFFATDGTVSSAAAMNVSRSRHFAVTLSDGRVLVGGGISSGGGTTNSVEIYDPTADSWTQTNPITSARANATAALLPDGRVLIAGGDNSGNPSNTIEIYDPASGSFSFAGTLSSPRTKHAMAVLQDGRVLILGGTDGTNPLASSDIFDPSSGNISAGPGLATARYAHSATTLLNGRVAVIGGAGSGSNGGTTDLASAEVFNPSTNAFSSAGASLATARQGHQAFLLPNNNGVLIVGGTSAGQVVAASELLTPQVSSADGSWSYAVNPTGSNVTARSAASGSAMKQDGLVLAAGGNDASGNALASTEIYAFPTVKTDQADYPPGTTVNITGSGFTPGEAVSITLVESPLIDTHGPYTITADASGNISDSSFTTDLHDVNVRFWLSAVGSQSGLQAQNTFTDANKIGSVTVGSQVGTLNAGTARSATYVVTVDRATGNGTNGAFTANLTVGTLPTGVTASFSPSSLSFASTDTTKTSTLTITTTAAATQQTTTFTVTATNSIASADNASGNGTLTIGAPLCTAPSITTQPTSQTITYGSNVTFTAAASGNPSPSVQWQVSTNGGSTWTNLSDGGVVSGSSTGTLTLTAPPASLSGNQYRAVFTNTCNGTQNANSNAATLTVSKVTVTATVTANDKTYDGTSTATQKACTLSGVLAADTNNVTCSASTLNFVDKNVGTAKTVSVSGISLSGTAAGNYQLLSTTGTATANISARAITVTAATNSKGYDGTTSAAATPTITSGTLATGDTAGFTETYGTKNVGTNLTLTPAGTVSDGNSGNNYAITFANDTTGAITARTITVTAATNSKGYDGTTSAAAVPTITRGSLASGDTASFTETYANKNVGTNLTLTPAGSVSDGNSGNNYAITFATNTTGAITARAITVTAATNSKGYDGTTSAAAVPTITSGSLASGDTASFTETYANKNVGTNLTLTPAGSVSDGNSGNNYAITFATNTTGVINALTITGNITADDKIYDGTVSATTHCTLTGVLTGDAANVSCGGTGSFADANAGPNKTVTSSNLALSGSASGNYVLSSTTATAAATISQADAVIKVNDYTGVYDGNAHGATGSATGVKSEDLSSLLYLGSSLTNVPGGTANWTFAGDTNYKSASGTAAITITQADAVIKVNGYTGVYDGNAHGATGSATGVKSEDLSSLLYLGSSFTNVPGGTANWTFAGNTNYKPASGTAAITITQADAVIKVNGYTGVYDGNAHGATGSATGVKSEDLSSLLNLGSSFTNVLGGTANWTFAGDTNYKSASGTAAITINKATATIKVTPYNVIYDGSSHTATGSATGVKGETLSGLDVSKTTHTNPGKYTADPWAFTDSTGNYNNANSTIQDSIQFATGGVCNNGLASGVILQPINADGSSVFKLGSTVPTKFVVCDAHGNSVGPTTDGVNTVVASYLIIGWTGNVATLDESVTSTTPDSAFRWDSTAQQWIFNTKTGTGNLSSKGTYLFQITLIDGTIIGSSGSGGKVPSAPFAGSFGYQYGLK